MPPTSASPHPDGLADALSARGIALEGVAGRGGSGVVHRARSAEGLPIAVKLLDAGTDVGRIRREADALAALSHDGVPQLIDVLELHGRPVMLSEWIDGTALIDELRNGPLAPQRAHSIFASLADVLDHVHAAGIVHRDLSPDNIIIRPGDRVCVIDFGISRSADSATLTAEGITAGTPRYVAPELLRGAEPAATADQYSAGILLAEMLTGSWPYPGDGDTIATTMHHHLHSAPVPVSERNTWLGPTFDAAIERALAKDPASRFPSMLEMLRAIDEPPSRAIRADRTDRTVAGRRPPAWVLVGLLLLLAAGALTVLLSLDEPAATTWPAGTADGLACNLVFEAGFESGTIPVGFYDGVADRNDIAPTGGVDGTAAIRVGATGDFGLYGETIPIVPGEGYVFRAFVAPTADVQGAVMRMFTLDDNFDLIEASGDPERGADEVEVVLDPGTAAHVTLTMPSVSPAARFLVPTLLKEGPDGYLVADELVLAPISSGCIREASQ